MKNNGTSTWKRVGTRWGLLWIDPAELEAKTKAGLTMINSWVRKDSDPRVLYIGNIQTGAKS